MKKILFITSLLLLNSCSSTNSSISQSTKLATISENNEEVILYSVDNKTIKGDIFGFKKTNILPGKHEVIARYRWINTIPVGNTNIQTSNSSNYVQKVCFFAKEDVSYEVRANPNTAKVYISGELISLFESEDATIPCN